MRIPTAAAASLVLLLGGASRCSSTGGFGVVVDAFLVAPSSSSSFSGDDRHHDYRTATFADDGDGVATMTTTALRMDPGGFAALDGLDAAVTTSIFGAAVAATVKLAGKNDDDAPRAQASESAAVAAADEDIEEEEPPEPELSEPKAAIVEPEPEAEEEVEPAAPRDISELKREVAHDIESQREMEDRKARREYERAVKKAAEEREAKAKAEAKAAPTWSKGAVDLRKVDVEAEGEQAIETLGRKRHLMRRLVRKAIMPWKSWSDL